MEKYKNNYRIASARASFWDYNWNAAYFVTLCTQNQERWFGEIKSRRDALPCVSLSEIGKIVKQEWLKTFEMRTDLNLSMGEYIVMPNHFHAIIGIGINEYNSYRKTDDSFIDNVDTNTNTKTGTILKNQFGPQSKNFASIIREYKTGATKNARKIDPDFEWQSRYHDHIIRDDESYQKITEYICNNPANWQADNLYR